MNLKYFSEEEFKRATPACSLSDMDESFMVKLDACREYAGVPFVINSAYRSVDYEKSKKRSGLSVHTQGKAVDIRCFTNDMRYRIIDACLAIGIRRIGIGRRFIHIDVGYEGCSPIIWLYDD